jgi:ABC-2 type transport system permease protein
MKNKISLIAVVYSFEWKQLRRSTSFVWLTLLLLLIGGYAIIYGRNEVSDQQRKISLLQKNIDSLYKVTTDSLQQHDTTASYAGEFLGRLHANYPDGMAALAFGQRDIHKFAEHITNGSYFYNKYASGNVNKTLSSEIVNPFKLLSGHLDISFVLLFLFPLYFILLTYNVYSAEAEGGTLGLLGVQPQPVSRIIKQKLFLRFFIVTSLGLLLLLTAGAFNQVLGDVRFWWFALSFITYMFCWAAIISLIVSFKKNSGFTALALVSSWIFFTLLIPALLNGLLNTVKPVSTRTELSAAVQKANAEVWALPKPIRIDSFKTLRPYYSNTFDSVGSWEDPKFYRINHYLTDFYIDPYEQKRVANVAERNHFADRLNYFSPVLITQSVFNELGGSNMQQILSYDTAGYNYFKEIMRFTDDYIFLKNDRMGINELQKMPLQEYKAAINKKQIVWQLLVLFLIGGVALFTGNLKMGK